MSMRMKCPATLWILIGSFGSLFANPVEWIRPGTETDQPVWGIQGGLQFAIAPAGFRPPQPRGLLRLGYPVLPDGGYDLVNFIAVEPVVDGKKGFSELEPSELDGVQGKRFWTGEPRETQADPKLPDPGRLWMPEPGVEQLDVLIRVERFQNGARIYFVVSQRSDAPDEIRLTVRTEPDSAPLDYCIMTATMGNMVRARQLWLGEEMVGSLDLYADYQGTDFAPHTFYGLDRLQRTPAGDLLAAISTDEDNPALIEPFPGSRIWRYDGVKVTQYWKKLQGTYRADLAVAVNARFTYWQSRRPIPGGVSFENFELRERFYEGQQFIFGITRKTPAELGFQRAWEGSEE